MKLKCVLLKIFLSSCLAAYTTIAFSTESSLIRSWKKSGLLVFSVPVKFDNFDPSLSLNAHTKMSLQLIFEPLIKVAAQQELQPLLAKTWTTSNDKRSIVITLNSEHYFSDKTEVTAQDVANSFLRICSPESKIYEIMKGLSGCIEHAEGKNIMPRVTILSKYQIKFDINCSPTNFLYQLSLPNLAITKSTKNGLIGSGPYKLQKARANYLLLSKNPYFIHINQVKNNGIALFYADDNTVSKKLKTEMPDGALMYRMSKIGNFKNDHYELKKIIPNITEILTLNNQVYPFNHSIVRQALAADVYNNLDLHCICGAHKAYGIIPYGTGGSLANNYPDSLPNISPSEVFKTVPKLKQKTAHVTIHQLADLKNDYESNQIKAIAKKYNIDLKFKYHKSYDTLVPLYLNHKVDGFLELYVFKNREAYTVLQYFSNIGENNANIKDDKIDYLLQAAITESSSHGRFIAYREIARYLQMKGIVIPLYYMEHGNILNKCINGITENFLFNPFMYLSELYKDKNCSV